MRAFDGIRLSDKYFDRVSTTAQLESAYRLHATAEKLDEMTAMLDAATYPVPVSLKNGRGG